MLKIVIADDHPLIRKGLKQILGESLYIEKVEEAGDGEELMGLLRKGTYDVVVLDISLPGKDGLELLKDLKHQYPTLPVLILSIQPEEQYAIRALRSGASGCLNKASAPEELVAAIRRLASGGTYITPTVEELLLKDLKRTKGELPHQSLSDREYQVFILLASGKTPSEIACKLSLSVKTVSTYRARLLEKMGLKTNAELTQYAFKHGLIR
ncbi:MAG: response regulator transcription factor [Spirochaetes bacterium]|nr:response regulator transcription factor [Spirochaetota bacterium]